MKVHLDALDAAMADSPELSAHLRTRASLLEPAATTYERVVRVPFGLIGAPTSLGADVELRLIKPPVPFRPEHMVLSPESAHNFELVTFVISGMNQYLDREPLPLDTFSVEHLKNDRLSELQAWKGDTCDPSTSIKIAVRRVQRRGKFAFRGLLWGVAGLGSRSQPSPFGRPWPPGYPVGFGGPRQWCPLCQSMSCRVPGHPWA